jgi:hypothetical protein
VSSQLFSFHDSEALSTGVLDPLAILYIAGVRDNSYCWKEGEAGTIRGHLETR